MGKYYDNNDRQKIVHLMGYKWRIIPEKEFNETYDDISYRNLLDDGLMPVEPANGDISEDISNLDPIWPDLNRRFEVEFSQAEDGTIEIKDIEYPMEDEDDPYTTVSLIILNKREKKYFTELVSEALKDDENYGAKAVNDRKASEQYRIVVAIFSRFWGSLETTGWITKKPIADAMEASDKDGSWYDLVSRWAEEYLDQNGPIPNDFFKKNVLAQEQTSVYEFFRQKVCGLVKAA